MDNVKKLDELRGHVEPSVERTGLPTLCGWVLCNRLNNPALQKQFEELDDPIMKRYVAWWNAQTS